jgi:hypothetical protein
LKEVVKKIEYVPIETFVDRLNQGKPEFPVDKEAIEMTHEFQDDLR